LGATRRPRHAAVLIADRFAGSAPLQDRDRGTPRTQLVVDQHYMMGVLALMLHGHVGEGINDAPADPDGDRTESQFVEPLSSRRQGIFPHQHAAVIPEYSVRPADFFN